MLPAAPSWLKFKKWRSKRSQAEGSAASGSGSSNALDDATAKRRNESDDYLVMGCDHALECKENEMPRPNVEQQREENEEEEEGEVKRNSRRPQRKLTHLIPRSLSNIISRALSPANQRHNQPAGNAQGCAISQQQQPNSLKKNATCSNRLIAQTTTTADQLQRSESPLRKFRRHLSGKQQEAAAACGQRRGQDCASDGKVARREQIAEETKTTNKQQPSSSSSSFVATQGREDERRTIGDSLTALSQRGERNGAPPPPQSRGDRGGANFACGPPPPIGAPAGGSGEARQLGEGGGGGAQVAPASNNNNSIGRSDEEEVEGGGRAKEDEATKATRPGSGRTEATASLAPCQLDLGAPADCGKLVVGATTPSGGCHLTARTRDNQCALHGNAPSEQQQSCKVELAPRNAAPGDSQQAPEIQRRAASRRGAMRQTPRSRARGVPTWPLAKQTLDNNLAGELRLGHFGDCEDLLSAHLAGRLFGALTAAAPFQKPLANTNNNNNKRPSSSCNASSNCQGTRARLIFESTTIELRLVEQLRAFNYNHKRPFGRAYESPPTGWLYNATGLQPINSGSTATLKAKLFASAGFRRRSYDDQEGDNDFNIILQPSDIENIERAAAAQYAQLKAASANGQQQDNYNNNNNDRRELPNPNQNPKSLDSLPLSHHHCHQQQSHNAADNVNPQEGGLQEAKQQTNNNNNQTQINQSQNLNQNSQKRNLRHHRRRPPRQVALASLFEDIKLAKCLLDQDYNQTVRLFIQRSALNWNFNSFTFDALCCGRSLTQLLLHLFDYYHLYATFQLDFVKALKCFRLLEFGYHSTNPYHNSVHAADVTQAMHCFIQENKIRRHMTDLEVLAAILAAVCHDLDHPGVNQSFLIATNNPLASLYGNTSVLENHHWRFALCIFKESQLFDHFDASTLADLRDQLKQLILATDIARQNEYLKRFRELTSSGTFSMANTADRALVLQMALKCADLGNPCRPWMISRVWSNLICDEFYRMGAIERRLGVPLTPICQRHKTSIAGIQTDFFRFIVLPLLELWHGFLGSPLSTVLMANFEHNYKRWQRASRIVQQLRRRKSVACLEPIAQAAGCKQDPNRDSDTAKRLGGDFRRRSSLFEEGSIKEAAAATAAAAAANDDEPMHSGGHHSIRVLKRASSDYIKSGNGRLEVLRDFQLNCMIEKSPRPAAVTTAAANKRAHKRHNNGTEVGFFILELQQQHVLHQDESIVLRA